MNKKTIAAGAAAAALAGTIALGGTAAADSCKPGQVQTAYGCGDVTGEIKGEQGSPTGIRSFVTPVVGVDFRDEDGNKTGSGFYPANSFEYLGKKKQGKNGDGVLILVRQETKQDSPTVVQSGYGTIYKGWIPVKYTQIPSMFD
ncbi:hypothetical protein SEA_JUSTBECAUSE_16 [Streptomyces phage JustBecause]|jgi:hypothetical protein|nr:hypothetical protein SEA_JUSTBECAUSE_16 [Streptomyces phage JustBecause]